MGCFLFLGALAVVAAIIADMFDIDFWLTFIVVTVVVGWIGYLANKDD